jgi:SEC-C motif domain protein
MPTKKSTESPCPCGNPQGYAKCCALYHNGDVALTAEVLMRSRYSAYVLSLEPYLLATWHAGTRPQSLDLDHETRWLGLEIRRHETSGTNRAIVEFVARYKIAGRAYRLHEISRFLREEGFWYYLDGDYPAKANR